MYLKITVDEEKVNVWDSGLHYDVDILYTYCVPLPAEEQREERGERIEKEGQNFHTHLKHAMIPVSENMKHFLTLWR